MRAKLQKKVKHSNTICIKNAFLPYLFFLDLAHPIHFHYLCIQFAEKGSNRFNCNSLPVP